jgi:hypothetical protein
MQKHERKLIDSLALLTIVISLSSVGSMYVYYIGTFDTFLMPLIVHQFIIILLGVASFIYLGYALYLYHKNQVKD